MTFDPQWEFLVLQNIVNLVCLFSMHVKDAQQGDGRSPSAASSHRESVAGSVAGSLRDEPASEMKTEPTEDELDCGAEQGTGDDETAATGDDKENEQADGQKNETEEDTGGNKEAIVVESTSAKKAKKLMRRVSEIGSKKGAINAMGRRSSSLTGMGLKMGPKKGSTGGQKPKLASQQSSASLTPSAKGSKTKILKGNKKGSKSSVLGSKGRKTLFATCTSCIRRTHGAVVAARDVPIVACAHYLHTVVEVAYVHVSASTLLLPDTHISFTSGSTQPDIRQHVPFPCLGYACKSSSTCSLI